MIDPASGILATPEGPGRRKTIIIALILIVMLGICVRVYKLSAQSLWWDEGFTYLFAEDIRKGGAIQCITNPAPMSRYSNSDKAQPLFAVLSSFVPDTFGPEVHIRAVSVVASILTIGAFWLFFRVQELNRYEGAAALAFVSLSPLLIFYSQEGRPYALVMLWLVLFLWVVEREREFLSTAAVVAIPILVLLIGITHFMALFPVAAVLLWKVWASRKEKAVLRHWLLSGGLTVLAGVPALYLAWLHRGYTSPGEISVHRYLYALYSFIVGFSFGPSVHELHLDTSLAVLKGYLGAVIAVGVVGGSILISGAIEAIRMRRLFLVVVPLLTLVFISVFMVAIHAPLNPRHFISIFPFFVVLLALGLISIKFHLMRCILGGGLFLILVLSLYNYYFTERYHKEDYQGVAQFVESEAKSGETVLVGVMAPFSVYYKGVADVVQLTAGDEEFFQFLEGPNRGGVWVVLSRPWGFDQRGDKERFLRSNAGLYEFLYVKVFHMVSAVKANTAK